MFNEVSFCWASLEQIRMECHWKASCLLDELMRALVCLVGCPASVTSPLISTIWCFRPYKPYIFCQDMILATCQCQHIFCCWVEPSLPLSSLNSFELLYKPSGISLVEMALSIIGSEDTWDEGIQKVGIPGRMHLKIFEDTFLLKNISTNYRYAWILI